MAYNVSDEASVLSLVLVFFSVFFGGFIVNLSEAHKALAMFVFGDTLVGVGNNNHLTLAVQKANFPHHGIDFLTTNATGRFRNGKIVADFLGFKHILDACCSLGKHHAEMLFMPKAVYCTNRNEYLFWDGYHYKEKTHHVLVDYTFNGTSPYTYIPLT